MDITHQLLQRPARRAPLAVRGRKPGDFVLFRDGAVYVVVNARGTLRRVKDKAGRPLMATPEMWAAAKEQPG